MTNIISIIFWKDLRETLRDRRNIMRMFLLPAFMIPLLGHYFMAFADSHSEKLTKEVLPYAVVGAEYLPELVKLYAADTTFSRVDIPADQVEAAIKNKQIKFALKIPEGANEQIKNGERVSVQFLYYQAAASEAAVKERGTAPLLNYSERQRDWRLVFLGVAGEDNRSKLLNPVTIDVVNTASDREKIGHNLGTIIAYPLLILCFMGCTFTAVDLVAGEKEKGTLEILVTMPVPRHQIVLGKYLVVLLIGLVYSTLSMISVSTWLIFEAMSASEGFKSVMTGIGALDIFLLWLMLVPVTAFFAAVVLAISVYAKSFREANTLTGFANMFVVVSAMIIFIPGVNLTWMWSAVPVSNVGLVIRELIKGTLQNYLMIVSIFSTTAIVGFALLLFSTAWFRKEAVIFRE